MQLKQYFFLFFISCYVSTASAQKAFDIDDSGYIADSSFHALIKTRGYELVGKFSAVSKKSKTYYAKVLKNDFWGFIDQYGTEVIPPRYTSVGNFKDKKVVVSFMTYKIPPNSKCGYADPEQRMRLIDYKGTIIAEYNSIGNFHVNRAIVVSDRKFGLIDSKGNLLLPCIYKVINHYQEYTIVLKDKKWRLFNQKKNTVSKYTYDFISRYNGFTLGYLDTEVLILDEDTGAPLSSITDNISNFNDHNLQKNEAGYKAKVLVIRTEEGCIMLNRKGKKVTSKTYKWIAQITNHYFQVRDGDCWGIMNHKGKIIIDIQYDLPVWYLGANVFGTKFNGETLYVEGRTNKPLFTQYKNIGAFKNGIAALMIDATGKHGYINRKGKLIIPIVYDNYTRMEFSGGSPLRKNKKWGVLNTRGKIMIPFNYEEIRKSGNDFFAKLHGKWGLLDKKGTVVIPFLYSSFSNAKMSNKDVYKVQLDGKWGIIDRFNNVIVPIQYDWVENSFRDGLLEVKQNDLYGLVNTSGKEAISPKYTVFNEFGYGFEENGFAKVTTPDNTELLIDRYQNEIKIQYDQFGFENIQF